MRRHNHDIWHHAVIIDSRFSAFGQIEERLFDEKHLMLFRKPREKLLRALPDKSPAKMTEYDDAVLADGSFDGRLQNHNRIFSCLWFNILRFRACWRDRRLNPLTYWRKLLFSF